MMREFWYYHVSLLFFSLLILPTLLCLKLKGGNYLKPFVYFFLHYKQISFVYIFAVYDNTRTVCALYVLFFLFWVFRVSRIILNCLFFLYPHITLLGTLGSLGHFTGILKDYPNVFGYKTYPKGYLWNFLLTENQY